MNCFFSTHYRDFKSFTETTQFLLHTSLPFADTVALSTLNDHRSSFILSVNRRLGWPKESVAIFIFFPRLMIFISFRAEILQSIDSTTMNSSIELSNTFGIFSSATYCRSPMASVGVTRAYYLLSYKSFFSSWLLSRFYPQLHQRTS